MHQLIEKQPKWVAKETEEGKTTTTTQHNEKNPTK